MDGLAEDKKQKYEELYNKYCRFMKYIALRTVGDESLAEDAVQNAFIKLFRYASKIEEIDSNKTRALVSVVTESECKDLLKKEKSYKKREERVAEASVYVKEAETGLSVKAELQDALEFLPEKYKAVLMLKAYYGFSDKEIAEVLNLTNSNVRKRLQRAREIFLKKGEKAL